MKLLEYWSAGLKALHESSFLKGTQYLGIAILGFIGAVLVLLLITFLLRLFFRRHPLIDRAHRTLIYLLTMSGVALLVLAGILGLFLPIIPGIPLLLAGLLLMRKYHKWQWLEAKIAQFKKKVHAYRERRRAKREAMRKGAAALPRKGVRKKAAPRKQYSAKH